MPRRSRPSPPPAKPPRRPPLPRPPLPPLVLAVKYALWEGSIKPAKPLVPPPAAREAAPATPAPPAPAIAAVGQPAPPVAAPAPPAKPDISPDISSAAPAETQIETATWADIPRDNPRAPPARPAPVDERMYCQRRALWCRTDFCDSEHARSQVPKPDPCGSRWHCYRCPDWAARHAPPAPGDSPPPAWESRCVRCNELTNRLILSVYCPSCYNRARETIIGLNSRGRPVQFLPRLARYRIAAIYPPAERITFVTVTAAHWIEALRVVVSVAARAGTRCWIIPKLSERIGVPKTIRPAITAGPAIASSELPPSAHRPPLAPLAVSAVGMTRSPATPARC